jgi:hypothetical protein
MIFIKGGTPSSKNGQRWTGKYLIGSKATIKYLKESKSQWVEQKEAFLKMIEGRELPLLIGFHYVRKSRHIWDFVNPCQTIQDQMTHYGWISDDNTTIMFPIPLKMNGKFETYDKENPGVYITIIDNLSYTYS